MSASNAKKSSRRPAKSNAIQKPLDQLDRQILSELARDGRLANNVLAERLGIAASTALMRTQSLLRRGIIRGFRADIDHSRIGADVQALVSVRVRANARASLNEFGQLLSREPGVLNVFFIAGAFDFLVHIASPDTEGLRAFVSETLSMRPEVESTQTSLVFEHIPGSNPSL